MSEVHFLDELARGLFASSASRRSRNYYGLGFAGNKKIAREYDDVAGVLRNSMCDHGYTYVCASVCGTAEAVTGGAMRRKSLARFQSSFYVRPLFAAKNDYTAGGRDIGASLRLSSFLIIVYRDPGNPSPE